MLLKCFTCNCISIKYTDDIYSKKKDYYHQQLQYYTQEMSTKIQRHNIKHAYNLYTIYEYDEDDEDNYL
jgi:hypothetical protein